MRMGRCCGTLVCCLPFLLPLPAVHANTPLKSGDVVVALRQSPLRINDTSVHFVRRGTILGVESVNEQWLWVTQGKSGWILQADVIPRENAVVYFSQEIAKRPTNADSLRCRGKAYLSFGDAHKALADFNRALVLAPSCLLYADRGLAWSLAGEYDKAIADFSEAIRTHPSQHLTDDELAVIYCLRGLAGAGKGDMARAVADFNEAIRLSPDLAFAFNQRGKAWLADGNSTMRGVADFNEAIRLNPIFDSAYNNRGLAWASMGEMDKAIADFRAAMDLDPGSTFSRNTRSRLLAETTAGAKQYSHDALRMLDPLDSPGNNLSLLLSTCPDQRFREGAEGLRVAQRLCELDGYRFPPFLSTLAAACAETGDFAGAVKWQSKALELATTATQKEQEDHQARLALYQSGKPYRQKARQ